MFFAALYHPKSLWRKIHLQKQQIMTRILHEQFKQMALSACAEEMRRDCYAPLEKLCESAQKQVHKLEGLESELVTSQYTTLCNKLIAEIVQCMGARREMYLPYIQTLVEKVAAEHNCSSCSGGCKINHDIQIIEMQASHQHIKNILNQLNMVSLPLYSETIFPDTYRVLRNQMALIENMLTELLYLEEHYLIPKVIDAQKTINAGS